MVPASRVDELIQRRRGDRARLRLDHLPDFHLRGRARICSGPAARRHFPAVGRISPDYLCMDGTIPRGALPRRWRASAISRQNTISRVANVFHAGDGNLHPLILYDANKPGEMERAEAFGADILRVCVELGGVLTGEHGVGIEKRDLMPEMFSEIDLNQQQRLKCAFDAQGLLNPGKVFPTLHRCAELEPRPCARRQAGVSRHSAGSQDAVCRLVGAYWLGSDSENASSRAAKRRTADSEATARRKPSPHVFLLLRTFARAPAGAFFLQFALIVINGGTDEIFQSALIDLVTLEKIDRSSRVAFEARVEELVGIREARAVSKGKLHLVFVGVADRDHSVARPHRASHPLPFLDDLPVGRKDALADAGERFATPVREFCDQLVDTFRWIHWIFLTPGEAVCDHFFYFLRERSCVRRTTCGGKGRLSARTDGRSAAAICAAIRMVSSVASTAWAWNVGNTAKVSGSGLAIGLEHAADEPPG